MSTDEVFRRVRRILIEALNVEEEEVTLQATVIGDLGAEPIDLLDIAFRLEQAFSVGESRIRVASRELFAEPAGQLRGPSAPPHDFDVQHIVSFMSALLQK